MQQWRKIHIDIWDNQQVMKLPLQARLLYFHMISMADDHGRFNADGAVLRKAFIYDDYNAEQVRGWSGAIERSGLIKTYEKDGTLFAYHPNWKKYQGGRQPAVRPDKNPSEIQPPDNIGTTSGQHFANILPTSNQHLDDVKTTQKERKKEENRKEKKRRDKKNTYAADAASASKNKLDDNTPMDLKEFIKWCDKSPNRHIKIIAMYADEKNAMEQTKGQWEVFIRRNTRAARLLSPYTDDQIAVAFKRLKQAEQDYLKRWTLETLIKYLESDN